MQHFNSSYHHSMHNHWTFYKTVVLVINHRKSFIDQLSHKIVYGLSIDRNPINLMHLSLFTILFTVANTCLLNVGHFDCDPLN